MTPPGKCKRYFFASSAALCPFLYGWQPSGDDAPFDSPGNIGASDCSSSRRTRNASIRSGFAKPFFPMELSEGQSAEAITIPDQFSPL